MSPCRSELPVYPSPGPYGGDEEVRTPDPLRARQVLSQLSYTPILAGFQVPATFLQLLKVPFRAFKIKQHLIEFIQE